ncbi:solute carrier family 23 member 2 isoform X2 [Tetranychus urticae]|uniref:SLC26A/SulP transporter domain-containing protein n=2 Tax=Tetranychus urticae TaxID=32264 RepID=T1KC27_TETUR|nr:solute carrier family 23 member 2 isoform X2 [Tetranychus urticae]
MAYVYMISPHLCIDDNDPVRGHILSTCFFVAGFASLLMATFGVRLPVAQGTAFYFLLPVIAYFESSNDTCSILRKQFNGTIPMDSPEYHEAWTQRIRIVQGSILVASLTEVVIGLTGLVGFLFRYITPLTMGPTVVQLGISLTPMAAEKAGQNWIISGLTIIMITILSQYMTNVFIPIPRISKSRNNRRFRSFYVFKMFGILLSILIAWFVCSMGTQFNLFKEDDPARTDKIVGNPISDSAWLRIPTPFEWGTPIFSLSAILVAFTGLLTSMSDNIGDYYACSAVSNCPPPPIAVINRGVFIEGIGSIVSALWGAPTALSSYSSNIGTITITKVASRRVTQVFGLWLIVFSFCGKLSAIFVSIPDPVMGGVFFVMTSIIIAVGFNILKDIDFESPRNLYILGISVTLGSTIPTFFTAKSSNMHNNFQSLSWLLNNETVQTLLSNGMLVTGIIGFILDNTVPGTRKERGLHGRNLRSGVVSSETFHIYKLPWNMDNWLRKCFPFLPIYLKKDTTL